MISTAKAAFATDDGSNLNQQFGRLHGFVVVTIEEGIEAKREFLARPQQADQPGDRRRNHAALLDPVDDCDLLIAGGMGLPMAKHVEDRGLQLILTATPQIETALAHLLEGTLTHEADRAHQPSH